MTVQELIDDLQEYPPDAQVVTSGPFGGYFWVNKTGMIDAQADDQLPDRQLKLWIGNYIVTPPDVF